MRLVVEAEVATPAASVPPPGVAHALQVDCYVVHCVVNGDYPHGLLYAAREAGTPFRVGERLRLTLSPEIPDDGAPLVTEPQEVARFGLYYVVAFVKL